MGSGWAGLPMKDLLPGGSVGVSNSGRVCKAPRCQSIKYRT